jgi:hypothetical protein
VSPKKTPVQELLRKHFALTMKQKTDGICKTKNVKNHMKIWFLRLYFLMQLAHPIPRTGQTMGSLLHTANQAYMGVHRRKNKVTVNTFQLLTPLTLRNNCQMQ